MTRYGFHASHEQVPARQQLADVHRAEQAGFEVAMCSDTTSLHGVADRGTLRSRGSERRWPPPRSSRPPTYARRKPAGVGTESLTEREHQVARLVVDRKTNPEIAAELFLSPKTVETHIRNMLRKLDVDSRMGIARAIEPANREQHAPHR
jgi:DNA-binding NarL/FixJ family response regulator